MHVWDPARNPDIFALRSTLQHAARRQGGRGGPVGLYSGGAPRGDLADRLADHVVGTAGSGVVARTAPCLARSSRGPQQIMRIMRTSSQHDLIWSWVAPRALAGLQPSIRFFSTDEEAWASDEESEVGLGGGVTIARA